MRAQRYCSGVPVDVRDPALRLAMFEVWGERCGWCGEPIHYVEMEIDHVIPKHLNGEALAKVLEDFGLPGDFDLLALENLVPSCGACNGASRKGRRPPPNVPIVANLRRTAADRAGAIAERADRFRGDAELAKALTVIEVHSLSMNRSVEERELLKHAVEIASGRVRPRGEGEPPRIHPAVSLLWDRHRWSFVRELGPEVAVVTDGTRHAMTGTHVSWTCSRCQSNGPWNGVICVTCGNREQPDI